MAARYFPLPLENCSTLVIDDAQIVSQRSSLALRYFELDPLPLFDGPVAP
jgi:hypothetical protein